MVSTDEKWVTFDCYGTLIDWRSGISKSLDIIAPGRGHDLLGVHRKYEGEIEINEPYQPYREVLMESVRRMMAHFDLPLSAGDEEVLIATMPFWHLYEDSNASLKELKADGWKLGIFSNVDRDIIAQTLRRFDVMFDMVITAQDVKSYKPNDAHARHFLKETGIDPSRWLYAAVNNQYDLVPGAALGATTVWINRDAETGLPTDHLYDNVPDMASLPAVARRFIS